MSESTQKKVVCDSIGRCIKEDRKYGRARFFDITALGCMHAVPHDAIETCHNACRDRWGRCRPVKEEEIEHTDG